MRFIVYRAKNGKAVFITTRKNEIEFLNEYSAEFDPSNTYDLRDFDRVEDKDYCVLIEHKKSYLSHSDECVD